MMGYSLVGFVHPGDEDLVKLQIEKAKKELIQKGKTRRAMELPIAQHW